MRMTCRPLITSINSLIRVYKSSIHLNVEIIIEYNYIDVDI